MKKLRQASNLCRKVELKIGRCSARCGLERGSDQEVFSECKRRIEVEAALRRVCPRADDRLAVLKSRKMRIQHAQLTTCCEHLA